MTFARGTQTMHFWEALITFHHYAKFKDVLNSHLEKCNDNGFYHPTPMPTSTPPTDNAKRDASLFDKFIKNFDVALFSDYGCSS